MNATKPDALNTAKPDALNASEPDALTTRPPLRLVGGLATAAGAIALLALAEWFSGQTAAGALGVRNLLMAPSTAILVTMLSVSAILNVGRPVSVTAKGIVLLSVLASLAACLLAWARPLFGVDVAVDRWLMRMVTVADGTPVRRMSLPSATGLVLVALALLLESHPIARSRRHRRAASLLAVATLLTGLVVLLSYAAGSPLLSDRGIRSDVPARLSVVRAPGTGLAGVRRIGHLAPLPLSP